jgi:beta-glucosidase/6-phospho-beta-glucosidase/beta-galactosidase
VIAGGDRCGACSDFWERYAEDVARAAALGSNCFRVSLEWSRLQPGGPGAPLDAAAVARYHRLLDEMAAHGLEPFLTLHHFVHPLWFEKLGGFAKAENISPFVDYARRVFAEYGSRARFWATFNEPGVASFAGFIHGSFPPGRFLRVAAHGRHLLHMLRAHGAAYAAIKGAPGGAAASVGLVHNWFSFEAAPLACLGAPPPWTAAAAALLNRAWSNAAVLRYLRTGVFEHDPLRLGGLAAVRFAEPCGPPGCDHFGLNFYSRGVMDWKLTPTCYPGETMTDMPVGLWRGCGWLGFGFESRLCDVGVRLT